VEHPEALVDGFTTARDTLAGASPPDEIARDWAVVTTYLTMIADELEATGSGDTDELSRAIDRVGRRIDTGALTSSSQAVTDFFRAGCARGAARPPPACRGAAVACDTWGAVPTWAVRGSARLRGRKRWVS